MSTLLGFIFFLSGASALLFETLWFFQSGLALGNSIWASSLVLASFMAGLALGNGPLPRSVLHGWVKINFVNTGFWGLKLRL